MFPLAIALSVARRDSHVTNSRDPLSVWDRLCMQKGNDNNSEYSSFEISLIH
jgi:hypothetical protein